MRQVMKTLIMLVVAGLISLAWHHDGSAGYIMTDSSIMLSVANGGGTSDDATCTSEFPKGEKTEGLLTQIIDYIKEVINQATQELYEGIIKHTSYQKALGAAFTLFITLFGVLFIFGIVPLTFGQAATRMFKFAIILALTTEGFKFFNEYVIKFFNDGTDELIDAIIGIATGDTSSVSYNNGTPQPFTKLEGVVEKVLSSKNMVAIIGSSLTGPSGLPMGGILALGTMAFVQAIVKALRIYCLSLVAKALLFGMAPIFMSFMMFERTKHMFSGWTNQLVNYSLQPLFMFAFISFFIILMESAIDNILGVEFCWTEFDHWEGAASARAVWRPKNEEGKITSSDFTWQGFADCLAKGGNCKDFPISIIDMLAFLILAHLAYKFSDVVTLIATEIASSTLFLDKIRGGMGEYFQQFKGGDRARPTTPPR